MDGGAGECTERNAWCEDGAIIMKYISLTLVSNQAKTMIRVDCIESMFEVVNNPRGQYTILRTVSGEDWEVRDTLAEIVSLIFD